MKVQYRVRAINRFVVTRYHESEGGSVGGVDTKGTYDNPEVAHEVAYALCKAEHDAAGTPPDDPNFQYPESPNPSLSNSRVVARPEPDLSGISGNAG